MDPYSRGLGMKQACLLFVPQVKGSHICGVCRFPLNEHPRTPVAYSDSNKPIYVSAAELPRTATISPISKPHPLSLSSLSSTVQSLPRTSHKYLLTQSETSAFTQYSKSSSSSQSSPPSEISVSSHHSANSVDREANESAYQLRKCKTFSNNAILLKPKPLYLKPLDRNSEPVYYRNVPTVLVDDPNSKEDQLPSHIYRRIKAKQKERSRSAPRSAPSPTSELSEDEKRECFVIVQKEVVPRAHNFKQILDRFQGIFYSFEFHNASNQHVMREHNFRSLRSRDPNRRFTVDSFPVEHNPPNENVNYEKFQGPQSLTISIPTIKTPLRHPLPSRWKGIKETDIDDVPQTPAISETSLSPPTPPLRNISITGDNNISEKFISDGILRRSSNDSLKGDDSVRLRDRHARVFARARPYSQSDLANSESTSTMAVSEKKLQGSGRSSVTVSIPLSDAGWVDSPVPCPPSPSRSSQIHTPASHPPPTPITNHRAKTIDETYNQMTLNHRESLAYISDHLADYVRSRDVPLSNEKLNQLKFSEIIFKSYTPTLIKGASLFFEAAIRRDEQITYDITLMIAPASQYYPLSLSRRPAEAMLYHPPVLVEIDDNRGDVRRFLQHSSHFSARTCKAFVMPRLKLISFHSLAANNFDKRIDIETYERHVCFIMVQLVCALKSLQSDGVEQLSNNFREFLLAYRPTYSSPVLDISEYPRLILLRETVSDDLEESNRGSVSICKYALRALCTLLHHKMDNGVPTIPNHSQYSSTLLKCAEVLNEEKSSSLSNAKNILEYSFWLGANTEFENEFDAKIWLDSQRSRDVDRLVRVFVKNSESLNETVERLRVQFLLSITPRSLFTSSEMLRKSYY
ncbi:hypothetical protein Tcan_06384 [Toxocara canis]|uniref:Uncharacterized protein n=1 Tax=Toxocara canis TaxID=6265 RepID=A0A0B2W373_TOXCA|nr:hypothetical protein Tcan_06384 [Toxocara canis]